MSPHFETPLDAAKYAFENGERDTALRIVIDYLASAFPSPPPVEPTAERKGQGEPVEWVVEKSESPTCHDWREHLAVTDHLSALALARRLNAYGKSLGHAYRARSYPAGSTEVHKRMNAAGEYWRSPPAAQTPEPSEAGKGEAGDLRERRKNMCVSMGELAERSGLALTRVSDIERGIGEPPTAEELVAWLPRTDMEKFYLGQNMNYWSFYALAFEAGKAAGKGTGQSPEGPAHATGKEVAGSIPAETSTAGGSSPSVTRAGAGAQLHGGPEESPHSPEGPAEKSSDRAGFPGSPDIEASEALKPEEPKAPATDPNEPGGKA